MRVNGYIFFCTAEGGAFDEFGEPTTDTEMIEQSDRIPAFVQTISDNLQGKYEDGTFHQASYKVFVEGTHEVQHPANTYIDVYRQGQPLGQHKIISIETSDTFNRTTILL